MKLPTRGSKTRCRDPSMFRRFFICGSDMRGEPDHAVLEGARFLGEVQTAPVYRMHSVNAASSFQGLRHDFIHSREDLPVEFAGTIAGGNSSIRRP